MERLANERIVASYAHLTPLGWLIKRLIKVGARVSYHARRWCIHVASAFPLGHHYRAVLPGVLKLHRSEESRD